MMAIGEMLKMHNGIHEKSKKVWEEFATKYNELDLMFPDENLIRIFSGRYINVPQPPAKLLDHGFGGGNSLLLFAKRGYECYGCEITEELIKVAKEKFDRMSESITLSLIAGTKLDYPDNFLDIIVSWNAIHYNGTRENVQKVINEMHRILKPGGVTILSTLHPDNSILKRGQMTGDGSYMLKKESKFDNREGLLLFCPKKESELRNMFSDFSEVKLGYYNFNLFLPERAHAARLVYAKK
jgi:ubiquinone/menaquinone biosynthesis C-methylase UbiE